MERRTFLTGIGTLGSLAAGFAVRESSMTNARTNGLAQAAGAANNAVPTSTVARAGKVLATDGVTLVYLPGSAGMFGSPAIEQVLRTTSTGLRWATWDRSL